MSQDDIDLEKDLQLLHEIYQPESTEVAPESVDMKILQAAHEAVNTAGISGGPEKTESLKRKKRNWYVPMSAVAIIVLSLSVVLKLAFEPEQVMQDAAVPDAVSKRLEQKHSLQIQKMKESRIMEVQKRARKMVLPRLKDKEQVMSRVQVSSSPTGVAMSSLTAESSIRVSHSYQQKVAIENLRLLFETQQYKALKIAFIKYRKVYPLTVNEMALPQILIDWERENVAKFLQID